MILLVLSLSLFVVGEIIDFMLLFIVAQIYHNYVL